MKCVIKMMIAMKCWKYIYDYKATFTNELSFGIKLPSKSWCALDKPNQTRAEKFQKLWQN